MNLTCLSRSLNLFYSLSQFFQERACIMRCFMIMFVAFAHALMPPPLYIPGENLATHRTVPSCDVFRPIRYTYEHEYYRYNVHHCSFGGLEYHAQLAVYLIHDLTHVLFPFIHAHFNVSSAVPDIELSRCYMPFTFNVSSECHPARYMQWAEAVLGVFDPKHLKWTDGELRALNPAPALRECSFVMGNTERLLELVRGTVAGDIVDAELLLQELDEILTRAWEIHVVGLYSEQLHCEALSDYVDEVRAELQDVGVRTGVLSYM